MKKLFVSVPMSGKSCEDILAEQENILKKHEGYELIPTVFDFPPKTHGLVYLAKSIELLAEADLVVFAPYWWRARGCVIEHQCAYEYRLNIAYETA